PRQPERVGIRPEGRTQPKKRQGPAPIQRRRWQDNLVSWQSPPSAYLCCGKKPFIYINVRRAGFVTEKTKKFINIFCVVPGQMETIGHRKIAQKTACVYAHNRV